MVGGAWQAKVCGVTKELDTTQQLKQQKLLLPSCRGTSSSHLSAPLFPYLQSGAIVVTQVD